MKTLKHELYAIPNPKFDLCFIVFVWVVVQRRCWCGGSFSSSWMRHRCGWVIGVGGSSVSLRCCVVVNIQGFAVLRKRRHGEEFVIVHLRGPKSRVVPL